MLSKMWNLNGDVEFEWRLLNNFLSKELFSFGWELESWWIGMVFHMTNGPNE